MGQKHGQLWPLRNRYFFFHAEASFFYTCLSLDIPNDIEGIHSYIHASNKGADQPDKSSSLNIYIFSSLNSALIMINIARPMNMTFTV